MHGILHNFVHTSVDKEGNMIQERLKVIWGSYLILKKMNKR